ncbi:MAG: hypothetical protein IPP32_16790 [Bacteroidetes bacterium]|nr:hypothetical protein [Bacteroidota bacterium]
METTDNEELKKIAPHLFNIEKKEVFSTPDNYFEKLPGELQEKVTAQVKPKNYWVPNYKTALVTASIFVFILVGIRYYSSTSSSPTKEIAANEMVQEFDTLYLASANEIELADQLDDESLESASQQIEAGSDISSSEIEDYLISDNIDITTITNEF